MYKYAFIFLISFSAKLSAQIPQKQYYYSFDSLKSDSIPVGWIWEGHGTCKAINTFIFKSVVFIPFNYPASKYMLLLQKDSSNNPFGSLKTKIYPTCSMKYFETGYYGFSDKDYKFIHSNMNTLFKGYTHKNISSLADSEYIYTQEMDFDTLYLDIGAHGRQCLDTSVKSKMYDSIEIELTMRYMNNDFTYGSFVLLDDVTFYFDTLINNIGISNIKKCNTATLIYPNPSSGIFTVQYNTKLLQKMLVQVYNTIGEKVYETIWNNGVQKDIDLSYLAKGIYFLRIGDESKRIVIE